MNKKYIDAIKNKYTQMPREKESHSMELLYQRIHQVQQFVMTTNYRNEQVKVEKGLIIGKIR